ncbi:hypothetical protein DFH08DRAFT_814816 [Mycena albidolilacea]|uniref:Uncharacterized protein n=1 Tax=Mycena albidolilacea TaxID=1033008 RepID=A0AAD6ZP89_9AGAR|nr:hypothetical protein DFH08DRAFT_814816 [Mycena albidolilacea]
MSRMTSRVINAQITIIKHSGAATTDPAHMKALKIYERNYQAIESQAATHEIPLQYPSGSNAMGRWMRVTSSSSLGIHQKFSDCGGSPRWRRRRAYRAYTDAILDWDLANGTGFNKFEAPRNVLQCPCDQLLGLTPGVDGRRTECTVGQGDSRSDRSRGQGSCSGFLACGFPRRGDLRVDRPPSLSASFWSQRAFQRRDEGRRLSEREAGGCNPSASNEKDSPRKVAGTMNIQSYLSLLPLLQIVARPTAIFLPTPLPVTTSLSALLPDDD